MRFYYSKKSKNESMEKVEIIKTQIVKVKTHRFDNVRIYICAS